MDTTYKEALCNQIDEMCGSDEVNYTKELLTASVAVVAVVVFALFILAI